MLFKKLGPLSFLFIILKCLNTASAQSPQICDRAPDDIMKNLCLNMVDVMVNVSNFIAENPRKF